MTVVEETPVALVYNGISHAVMLATPGDFEDFALGFSLTEGIVQQASDVFDIEVVAFESGISIEITIASGAMAALKGRRRSMVGRTGCGLCGAERLADAVRPVRSVRASGSASSTALRKVLAQLEGEQHLRNATGASHAAAFASWDGDLLMLREDVGRHNALDKLVGGLSLSGIDTDTGFAFVTSRASVEMVHKTAAAGIGLLAALSAPTAMAVRTADEAGLTLIGLAGSRRPVTYSNKA
jgi:FdhD protein